MLSYRRLQPCRKYYPLIICCFLGLTIFKLGVLITTPTREMMKEQSDNRVAIEDIGRCGDPCTVRQLLLRDNVGDNATTVPRESGEKSITHETKVVQSEKYNTYSKKFGAETSFVSGELSKPSGRWDLLDLVVRKYDVCIGAEDTKGFFMSYLASFVDVINNIHRNVTISPSKVCAGKNTDPYLLIIISSMEEDFRYRDTIRNTWASTRKIENITIGRVFIVASNSTTTLSTDFLKEIEIYGDILLLNMEETYRNLIYKVFAGMTYMTDTCKGTRFLLKVDIDVYVHLPKLIKVLLGKLKMKPFVMGHVYMSSEVTREGRWGVSLEQYKFCKYLPYAEGNSYVISGELVPKLLDRALYVPLIHIEDAFITGILRYAVKGWMFHEEGFSGMMETIDRSKLREFEKSGKVSETRCSIETMQSLWKMHTYNVNST